MINGIYKIYYLQVERKILENNELTFKLSEEQKTHLLNQNNVPLEQCIDAEELYKKLKKKYDL